MAIVYQMPRMANLSILLILLIIFKLSRGRILDGLYLSPELLKSGGEIRRGNDYIDYNPDYVLREIKIFAIPLVDSNHIGVIEVTEEDIYIKGNVVEQNEERLFRRDETDNGNNVV